MKNVIREMKKSPAYSFIKEHIELEFQRLERDKITPWAFFLTKKRSKGDRFLRERDKLHRRKLGI
jgi:hypothetical protein